MDVSPQDVDIGTEAPGGSNPTPDQDIVDDIGKAVGVTYEDNEPLKFGDKVAGRDEDRWELNPASADDYQERREEEASSAKRAPKRPSPSRRKNTGAGAKPSQSKRPKS